jgi:quinol monooxygenase YgiN
MAQSISKMTLSVIGRLSRRNYIRRTLRSFGEAAWRNSMVKLAFLAHFEAKPGKEEEVAKFLETALDMARKESTTISWYAIRLSPSTFGVFDTFNNEDGRQKHLNGPIGQALMANAPVLFKSPPTIEPVEVLGYKS